MDNGVAVTNFLVQAFNSSSNGNVDNGHTIRSDRVVGASFSMEANDFMTFRQEMSTDGTTDKSACSSHKYFHDPNLKNSIIDSIYK
jgi:hypothetical protein